MSTLFDRTVGDRGTVTLNGVKLLSKPTLEIRQVKGIVQPQHYGKYDFEVETSEGKQRLFTIHINAHTREQDIAAVDAIDLGTTVDLVISPVDWAVTDRSGTKLFLKEIKES